MRWYVNLALLVVVGLGGCKGCKEKVDPCANQKPVTASFKTRENVAVSDYMKNYFLDIPCDTLIQNGEFTADEVDATSYTWKVGARVYQGKKLSLGFGNVTPGTVVPVKLIVIKTSNKNCFPDDDGIDSLTKNIKVTRGLIEGGAINIYGLGSTFEMPDYDDPSKKIQFGLYQEPGTDDLYRGFGFPKEMQKGDPTNSVDGGVGTAIQACYVVGSKAYSTTIRLIYKGGNVYDFYGEFYPKIDGKSRPDLVRKYHATARKI